jgi:hypothetical protein
MATFGRPDEKELREVIPDIRSAYIRMFETVLKQGIRNFGAITTELLSAGGLN